jgi:hypothetical protein
MASYAAIADVGNTLVRLLQNRTSTAIDDSEIVLGSPADDGAGTDYRLTIFLFDVRQNEHLSNDRARPESVSEYGGASLVLDLHYLLTAHPKKQQQQTRRTQKSLDQHEVLGRAMQILADNGIVRHPDLDDDLAEEPALSITFTGTDRRELLDIWGTFPETAYQPSVPFVVSPVLVDTEARTDPSRVLEGEFQEYVVESGEQL